MSRFLIIGYGSSLRGDDAAGRRVADRLAEILADEPEVEILSLPQLAPETVLPVSKAEHVYFIDAIGGANPVATCLRQVGEAREQGSGANIRDDAPPRRRTAPLLQRPGEWSCQSIAPEAMLANPLGHHYHPAALLAFSEALCHASPKAWIITVSAESFACGETLTPRVEAAVGEIVSFLLEEASGFLARHAFPSLPTGC